MIKLIKNSKIDITGTAVDIEEFPIKLGDKVIYYRSVGYPLKGWYLGQSPIVTGKQIGRAHV